MSSPCRLDASSWLSLGSSVSVVGLHLVAALIWLSQAPEPTRDDKWLRSPRQSVTKSLSCRKDCPCPAGTWGPDVLVRDWAWRMASEQAKAVEGGGRRLAPERG